MNHRRLLGTSLAEVLVAVVFLSIGFFGYVALHSRILHSGQRLEEREVIRQGTDFLEAIETGRVLLGSSTSITGSRYQPHPVLDSVYLVSTQPPSVDWPVEYPEEYLPGLVETLETSASVMTNPYEHSWEKR